ncbi:MAG: hypothetical protein ACHQFX_05990 [Chitinophagales bacterium]
MLNQLEGFSTIENHLVYVELYVIYVRSLSAAADGSIFRFQI